MSKAKKGLPTLGEVMLQQAVKAVPAPADVTAVTAEPVVARADTKTPVPPSRRGKRPYTVYLSPEAHRQLKKLAADEDAPILDLWIEAINDLFAKRGLNRIA